MKSIRFPRCGSIVREEDIDEEEIDLDENSPEEIEKMLAEADKMEVWLQMLDYA